ncbi:hypothetical protein GYH30_005766 [Glycine max]|nr:hypothetical protein GYH30_005766 [Glycine max]
MQKLGWEFVRQGFEIAKEKDDEIKWVALPDQKEAGHGHGFFSANTVASKAEGEVSWVSPIGEAKWHSRLQGGLSFGY